jgi:hypothetical protein
VIPQWRRDAVCARADNELVEKFFPSGRPAAEPKLLHRSCPVRQECLDFALDSPWQPRAIVAGYDPKDLMPLWRQRHPDYSQADMTRLLGLR